MKKLPLLAAGLAFGLACFTPASAQTEPAAPAVPAAEPSEIQQVIARISAKARAGEKSAAAYAPELADFDSLYAKYKSGQPEEAAQVLFLKAAIHVQLLGDETAGRELLERVQGEFPDAKVAADAGRVLAMLDRAVKAKAAQASLIGSPAPELNFKWSSREGLSKLSDLRGRVVVLDFWATWCGPCIASFPKVREHVNHFQGLPVSIIGVTSLQGRVMGLEAKPIITKDDPDREMALMSDFMKAKDMTWDVVFSEQEVFNPDYGIQGIPYVAIIAPDGTVRHAGLHPGDEAADITGKITAILKEFNLPAPN